jgi:hypothetical protein
LRDWNNPQKRKFVLQYNLEDTVNLFHIKEKIFESESISNDFLEENLLHCLPAEGLDFYTPEYRLKVERWN